MTSPVDTSVKAILSTFTNAPVVSGTVGSGLAWLTAVLQDGFDSRTLTSLVVSGGVATATFTGGQQGMVDAVVVIAGATGSWTALNGEQKLTAVSSTTYTFNTAAANGTATGTITSKIAPLGWTKVYSATNVGVFKCNDVASSTHYIQVTDTDALTMRVIGYESMSDAVTGTNPFPTTAQLSGGVFWPKSGVANSVAAPWYIFGNTLSFYPCIARNVPQTPVQSGVALYYGGDLASFKSSDPYRGVLVGAVLTTGWTTGSGTLAHGSCSAGSYICRATSGLGGSLQQISSSTVVGITGVTPTLGPYPAPADNALILTPTYSSASAVTVNGLRGIFPGLWLCPQSIAANSFASGDIINGTGDTAGRRLMAVFTPNTPSVSPDGTSISFFDITGPWPTPS